jgi:hemerythrin
MNFINWDKSLSVKVKEIDTQHKELIKLINKTHKLAKKTQNDSELTPLVDEMIEFARIHFSTEERYFDKYHYPDAEKHKKEHLKLLLKVLKFKDKLDAKQPILEDFLQFLKDWLEDHLKTQDHKYVGFFQECGLK